MKLSLSKRALRQLGEIHKYIEQIDPVAAKAVIERIYAALEHLKAHPNMAHATNEAGVCAYPIVRYPYLIFYRVDPERNEIEIVRIRHAARRHSGFQESPGEMFAS